jgi:transcriptional regulator GlxA family with amidase domain
MPNEREDKKVRPRRKSTKQSSIKTVAVLALRSVVPFDLGIACDVFSRVRLADGSPGFDVKVCSESNSVDAGFFQLRAPFRLLDAAAADILIVPGIEDLGRRVPPAAIRAIQTAKDNGALVSSICTGAFVLAAAGVLEGRRVATHWVAADELATRYPGISVDANVLFVDDGDIVTSAGSSAGLDMCLHLVGREYGQAAAAQAARLAVAPLHRDGGQAAYIRQAEPAAGRGLAPLFSWMLENLDKTLDVKAVATRANMSPRNFARRFHEQAGMTPIQWLLKFRVRRAQELLETTEASIEQVAMASGFDSPVTFRARFRSHVGVTPNVYRRRFRGVDAAKP